LADRFTLYYGGRLARIDEESTAAGSGLDPIPIVSQSSSQSIVEGHSIGPALGFHYSFIERLSIGAEIRLEHSDVDIDTISRAPSSSTQTTQGQITTNDTRADVILRFFF
jgi:hypothetical protein